jgi:hypothetical protein
MRFGPISLEVNSMTGTGRPPAWSDPVESEYWAGGGEAAGDLELRVYQLCLVLKLLPGMKPKNKKIPYLSCCLQRKLPNELKTTLVGQQGSWSFLWSMFDM